ncbi:MAG: citrate synthase [Ignavibacteriae bacterium]|nr:citrate synthase [Ignavibacteriota bacterium]MCB9215537.1 citrate synthase [Ignavibacteria bacterium]
MAESEGAQQKKGLEGIVAGETALSVIDGQQGLLSYCGYNIHDLVKGSFEETAYLLLNLRLPTQSELDEFSKKIEEESSLPQEVIKMIQTLPSGVNAMAALRGVFSALAYYDDESEDNSDEANRRKAIRLIAKTPIAVATFHRARNGAEPLMPKSGKSIAWNFLYMLFGEEPSDAKVELIDTSLILHADHGFNASTFACRVIAATLSDIYSAVTGAVGALKGPLHGGANERVMNMLLEINDVDKTESWLRSALENKVKVMGFGHRVYKTEDPRATHLRRMSEALAEDTGERKWYEMSQIIENIMVNEKHINPNVDFYSASSYYMMGIPIDLYTPIFAVSRVSGWVAHYIEQMNDNRLIRPGSIYIGERDLEYTSIDQR